MKYFCTSKDQSNFSCSTFEFDGAVIYLEANAADGNFVDTYLTLTDAQAFAADIIAACDQIEGVAVRK